MKTTLLLVLFAFISSQNYSQCEETVANFGNNSSVPAYTVSGDVTVTLNSNNTISLDLGSNFMTASGPDIRAFLVNSKGASNETLAATKIANLEYIEFGLVGASGTLNQNGAKSFTVHIPEEKDITKFDKVFFYCFQFNQLWDFGSFSSFTPSTCAVLSTQDEILNSVSVYPNPATNSFQMSNMDGLSAEIRIFNVLGKSVFYQNKNLEKPINISSLNTGVYMLKIDVQGKIKTQKLVIQ